MKHWFAALAVSVFVTTMAQASPLVWAAEDANGDGVWNYSVTNWNFQSANQWGNVPLSSDAYEGHSSLYFKYFNQDLDQDGSHTQAFGFALIATSNANNGTEPNSSQEYETGRDLRSYDAVEF